MAQPIYAVASINAGGYVMRGYRVGLNEATGQGQFPRPDGLHAALRAMPGGRLLVTTWGVPGWRLGNDPTRGSDTLDADGAVHATFAADKGDLMRWLLAPSRRGYALTPDRMGAAAQAYAPTLTTQFVYEMGGYAFDRVYSVTVWAPSS